MCSAPAFFLPEVPTDKPEELYAELAKWCKVKVPDLKSRIYSIGYDRGIDEKWTATVGECFRGVQIRQKRSRNRVVKHSVQLSDPAIVWAIFPGGPHYPHYLVVTNHLISGNVGSKMLNPFNTGPLTSITYFSSPG